MSVTSQTHLPSKYLQPSPVRGQLEPYNERSAKGWRYIQCTDTPNEFKVLLPPRTAALYDQLLKVELRELNQSPPLAWDRILEIRHLKDRMIRKSQRMSKIIRRPKGDSFTFHTALAPLDFRLKEMEKWLKMNQEMPPRERTKTPSEVSVNVVNPRNSYCCRRCATGAPHHPPPKEQHTELPLDHPLPSPARQPQPQQPQQRETKPTRRNTTREVTDNRRLSTASTLTRRSSTGTMSYEVYAVSGPQVTKVPREAPKLNRGHSDPQARRIVRGHEHLTQVSPPRVKPTTPTTKPVQKTVVEAPRVMSPEPLPHLLRQPSMGALVAPEESKREVSPPPPSPPAPVPATVPAPAAAPTPVPPPAPASPEAPKLQRRRSCIKRQNTATDPKTVSWAPDNEAMEQVGKYIKAADELKRSGSEYEEMRTSYLEHMAGLNALHQRVSESLDRLKAETKNLEQLQKEISTQRDKLRVTCDRLEVHHTQLQDKVQTVLDETNRAVTISQPTSEADATSQA